MQERDIMVRNESGQFEEVEQEALADELIAERDIRLEHGTKWHFKDERSNY